MKPEYRIFLATIIVAFFLTYLLLFINAGIHLLTQQPKAMDFIAFYTGAQLLAHSPSSLYNLHSQLFVEQHIAPITPSLFITYVNPPFTALLFEPLLSFGLTNAYIVWTCINGFLLLFLCYYTYQQIKKYKWYWQVFIFLLIFTFIPALTGLLIGQFSLLLTIIFLLTWIFLKKRWEFRSGLILSLLLIKPQLLIIPLAAMAMRRKSKFLFGLLTGIFFLVFISYLLVGWNGMVTYIFSLNDAYNGDLRYDIGLMAQHSLQTFLLILFHTQSLKEINALWISIVAGIVVPTLFIWSKKTSASSAQFALQFALLIIVTLITSPHTHFHDLSILLVVPIVLFPVMNKLPTKDKKLLIYLMVLGYVIQIVGFLFELQAKAVTQPFWISINVLYMLLFSFILMKHAYKTLRISDR